MEMKILEEEQTRSELMRKFLKRLVNDDRRAKQLFRLYFDRGELSEEQFYDAISRR